MRVKNMVKDNRQGGAMQDKEIRLKCLELALEQKELGAPVVVAKKYYDFVKSGVVELPPCPEKKMAPKLIDATKKFKNHCSH
jgi:hypothetical protein